LRVLDLINTECTSFVVQVYGEGWFRLWEATKLRKEQQKAARSFDPTKAQQYNAIQNVAKNTN
jgi:hypothetical protein